MRDIHHALVLEMHQPSGNLQDLVDNNDWEAKEVLFAYDRMPRVLWHYDDVARVNYAITGTLLASLSDPDFQRRIYGIVDCGSLLWSLQNTRLFEVLGTGYYHPLLALIPEADWDEQISRWGGIARHLFWRPQFAGFFPPDLGFDMRLIPHLKRAGYRYVLVDSEYVRPVDDMSWQEIRYRPHVAEYGGEEIVVVVRDRDLSAAQLAGMDCDWFLFELEERTKGCDFPPLVTTATPCENGGWFRNVDEEANFWTYFYRDALDRVRAGRTGMRPTFISDYLDRYGAHGRVTVERGAWDTGQHHGWDYTQWQGSQVQRDAMSRVHRVSLAFHQVAEEVAAAPPHAELQRVMGEAQWHLLRAETSDNFFWADAWLHKAHKDLDDAEWHLGEARAMLGRAREWIGEREQPRGGIELLGANVPICLLPVRLETRYMPSNQPTELWIRIYPDDPHIDAHERELTRAEFEHARDYWDDAWRAGSDAALLDAAWRRLSERVPANRAEWVVVRTRPLNDAHRPAAPIEDGQPLPIAPQLPDDLSLRSDPWTRAAMAQALPDQFVAIGYVGGKQVFRVLGQLVPELIQAGPSPDFGATEQESLALPDPEDQDLGLEDELLWLVDFDKAESIGMAIRVKLEPAFANGLDRLFVLGVRWSRQAGDGAETLKSLFDAHRYTEEGIAFLRPGTPTNNTTGERSAYTSDRSEIDPDHRNPLLTRRSSDGGSPAVGVVLAEALGLDPEFFRGLDGAERIDHVDDMYTALWPGTLGYYVGQMLLPLLDSATISELRTHFVKYVRGRGPLPALRIGVQPYGVLPVSARAPLASADDTFPAHLERFLNKLRGIARAAGDRAPRLGRTNDPARDLTEVLGQAPDMQALAGRSVLGRQYLENLWRHPHGEAAPISEQAFEIQRLVGELLLAAIGAGGSNARILQTANMDKDFPLRLPLVQDGEISETAPLEDNYIQNFERILNERDAVRRLQALPSKGPFLYLLLRHSALLAMGEIATRLHLADSRRPLGVLAEPELVDIETETRTPTALRLLEEPVLEMTGGLSVADFLAEATRKADARIKDWLDFRTALSRLTDLPTTELERLLKEMLDVLSYRFDAWQTSLTTRRLAEQRRSAPEGIYVGAWGYIENLRAQPLTPPLPAPEGQGDGAVFSDPSNAGFLHAPSLNQAATAAILRAGFLAQGGAQSELFNIDLSSQRVRHALHILDGIRQGQSLGALLGYRFERRLRERQLDQFVLRFRQLAPLTVDVQDEADAVDAAIAGRVVDGQRLIQLFEEEKVFSPDGRILAAAPHREALESEIKNLSATTDAYADLLVAEAVHQLVLGNHERSAAALAAIDGDEMPPEPDIIRTFRTGFGLTNRLLVLLDDSDVAAPGWPPPASRPRSAAEPRLDRWAGGLLGDPSRVRSQVVFLDESNHEIARARFTLDALGLCPLDCVYGVLSDGSEASTELELRLLLRGQELRPMQLPSSARPVLLPERDGGVEANEVSVAELALLAGELARVVGAARAVTGADLAPAEEPAVTPADLAELTHRADNAEQQLRERLSALESARDGADRWKIDEALRALADFGVPDAVPLRLEPSNVDPLEAARAQAVRALDRGRKRLEAAVKPRLDPAAEEPARLAFQTTRLETLFGRGFRAAPLLLAGNGNELSESLAHSTERQEGDPLAAAGWLVGAALVREGTERLSRLLMCAETLTKAPGAADLRVIQLPNEPSERWIGLESEGDQVPRATLSLVVHAFADLDPRRRLTGFAIDEWLEVIPKRSEATGLAFHYNGPNTSAPNCILLAVHPSGGKASWDLATLEATVLEAMDLARVRAADADSLRWVGRFLPALYFADNPRGDTAAIDLLKAAQQFRL